MKSNFLKINLIVFSLIFSLSSCSNEDDGGSPGNASNGTITASIDGNSFQSNAMFSVSNLIDQGGITTLTLQGTNNDGNGFTFVINGFDGVGTYDIGGSNTIFVNASYIEADATNPTNSQTWQSPYDDDSVRGEFQVNEDTGSNVKGTFEFTAKNSNDGSVKNITDGSFNLDY